MINLLKKIIFRIYISIAHSRYLLFRKIGYKFGQYFIKNIGSAVYKRSGVKLLLNPLNMIDKALIANKGHDKVVEEEIYTHLREGDVFIDVGANWGYFSILAASLAQITVIAFEPSLKELNVLYKHMLLNKFKNIYAYPLGLSKELSVQKLFLSGDRNTGQNSLVNDTNYAYTEALFAPVSNLVPNDFLLRTRLIKIDVEGYEFFVLNGFSEVIPQLFNCRFVVEITPGFLSKLNHTPKDIYNFFEQFGYKGKFGLSDLEQYDEIFYIPT